jgi:hypothetical protein
MRIFRPRGAHAKNPQGLKAMRVSLVDAGF